jgi:hypothetical protein
MSDIPNFDDDSDMIGWLEEQGALSWVGLGEDGEPLFKFNLDVLKTVFPELHDEITEEIDRDLMVLYEQGLVEVEYDEDLNARFRVSEKGGEILKDIPQNPFLN